QLQVLHVNRLVDLQFIDEHANRLRHGNGQALDFQVVDRLIQQTAGGHAGSGTAQLDADLDLDALVGGDAGEIDVQDVEAQVVPLHVADQGLFGLAVGLQINDAGAVADGLVRL